MAASKTLRNYAILADVAKANPGSSVQLRRFYRAAVNTVMRIFGLWINNLEGITNVRLRSYLYLATVVFYGATAFASVNASTRHLSPCFTFQAYGGETRTVVIRNSCAECRTAVIRWCDGSAVSRKVPRLTALHLEGFLGCKMQITADYRCTKQSVRRLSGQSQKTLYRVKIDGKTADISSSPERPPLKPSEDRHIVPPGRAANNPDAGAAKDAGEPAITNSMETANPAAGERLAAVSPREDKPEAQPKIIAKTRTQMALFTDLSEHDWGTLLCSESGQRLIKETEALLNRRAVLQIVLGDLWFSRDAVEKQEEWTAAEKEVQTINRELNELHEGAKAIIGGK